MADRTFHSDEATCKQLMSILYMSAGERRFPGRFSPHSYSWSLLYESCWVILVTITTFLDNKRCSGPWVHFISRHPGPKILHCQGLGSMLCIPTLFPNASQCEIIELSSQFCSLSCYYLLFKKNRQGRRDIFSPEVWGEIKKEWSREVKGRLREKLPALHPGQLLLGLWEVTGCMTNIQVGGMAKRELFWETLGETKRNDISIQGH